MSSTVTTTADEIAEDTNLAAQTVDGMGLSLREAIAIANADVLADVISFDASIVGLTLDTSPNGGIDITEDLTLASGATIFHNLTTPIFEVSNGASFTSHADIVLDSSNSAQSFSQLGAVRISGTNGTFSNTGTITTDAFGPNNEDRHGSINIEGQNATVNNAAGASIISQGRYVVYSFDFDDVTNDYIPDFLTINNDGFMQATDDTIRIGTGVINNTGTIRSTGELDFGGFWTPPGLASDGIAIVNQFDSSFVPGANGVLVVNNSATGIIEGPRAGINFSGGGTINNAGVIHGETTGFFTGGGNDFANTLVLNNSGSITGGSEDNGLNSGGFRGGVTVFGGLESAVVTNSGTISSDYHGFYSEEGIDITNTVTGLMKGDADGTGDDAVSFYGSRLIDFQVEVTLRSVFGIVDFVSAQSVTIMIAPDGNTELTIDGATYIVFNLELAQLTIVDAPYIMPLIDVAATQAANEIVFQSDANGLIYPASIDVVTANNGTLTVTYTSGQPLAVSDVNGNPVYVPSAAADYGDSINNRGVMDGDVITGVMPMTMSSTAGTVLTA